MDKFNALCKLLGNLSNVVVGFSGGVDSTLLAYLANKILDERALAVTAVSALHSQSGLQETINLAQTLQLQHQLISTRELEMEEVLRNQPDRCYWCKRTLFGDLNQIAQMRGALLLDGANFDDKMDYRPGQQAARELGVRSLFQELEITKAEIRDYSKEFSLPTWNRPADACLATRIPYGERITIEKLQRIEMAEDFLHQLGFLEVRVRDHAGLARVEISAGKLEEAWQKRAQIKFKLHELGFNYISLDLDGFRSGSMNLNKNINVQR